MTTEEVVDQAAPYLHEMSATHDQRITSAWQRAGRWMLRGFDVLLDEEGLLALRALDREHSLIFLISHRSYLDECVERYRSAGIKDVTLRSYPAARHEVLNETNRAEVEEDLLAWLARVLAWAFVRRTADCH